jgi:hypothetical protein
MTALYAAVDMRARDMLTRPEPKLRDKLDALGIIVVARAWRESNVQLKSPSSAAIRIWSATAS